MIATLRALVPASQACYPVQGDPAVVDPIDEELANALGIDVGRPGSLEPGLHLDLLRQATNVFDAQAGQLEELPPLGLRVVADVRWVAESIGLLGAVVEEEVVDEDHPVAAHPCHLGQSLLDVIEVVGRDATGDEVVRLVGEGKILAATDDIGPHAGRRIDGDDVDSGLTQAPRNMAAAGRHVERRLGALGPLDDKVEILPLAMRLAVAVQLSSLAPIHASSSTARFAASSIVGSTCRFGGAASWSSRRPSSAFVPSSRTTIGSSIVISSSP